MMMMSKTTMAMMTTLMMTMMMMMVMTTRISTITKCFQEAPWLMASPVRKDGEGSGYEGFSIDLLNALAKKLGFSYSLYPVPDGHRGDRLPLGHWTGLFAEITAQLGDRFIIT